MNTFFPSHIAAQIFTWAILTAGLFWLAIARSLNASTVGDFYKRRTKIGLALLLTVWFAFIVWTAREGTYRLDQGFIVPNLILAIAIPTAIGSLALLSGRARAVIDRVPQSWLAGMHSLRIVFGYVFIVCYELGELPGTFAFAAGYGDVVSGLLGATAAYLLIRGHRFAVPSLIVWNVVGIIDFLSVVPTGFNVIVTDAPFQWFYPFYLIPGFVVPLFLLLHVYSIRGLVRCTNWRTVHQGPRMAQKSDVTRIAGALPKTKTAGA